MGNIAVEPLSRAKIRGRAAFLRNVLGLHGLYIRIDIVLEIMSCPMKNADPLIEMEICEDYEMPNEYAVYSPQKNLLRVRNSVYEGACAGNPRDRFTWRTNWGIFSFIAIKFTSLHGRRGISRPTEIQNGRRIRLRQNSLCHMIKFRV